MCKAYADTHTSRTYILPIGALQGRNLLQTPTDWPKEYPYPGHHGPRIVLDRTLMEMLG